MKIIITTGIYPPKIGGPAQYAKNLEIELNKLGHSVIVKTFTIENYLPTGIRHLFFFIKILPSFFLCDYVISLDTYSVGFPTVLASKIFLKKSVIRTGGDFLWEGYVERTKKKVFLREFYDNEIKNFNLKEKIIFNITKWTLHNVKGLVFSTNWQREIFLRAYELNLKNIFVVENYFGQKEKSFDPEDFVFVASTRYLTWKNLDVLRRVFDNLQKNNSKIRLESRNVNYEKFMEIISRGYAVILVSLGDISPNMILDAIRMNKPFVCTKEVGIYDRIKDIGIYVDPLNEREIEEAVMRLIDPKEYQEQKEKIKNFNFTHTWSEISSEFIEIYKKI